MPFGLELERYNSESAHQPVDTYTGKPLERTFDLQAMNFGARFYDPHLGRWWQRDPLAEMAPSWSPYRFAFCNPLRFTDPDGRTEAERSALLTAAKKYIAMNPKKDKNQYEHGKKGDPGEKVDCSGLVLRSLEEVAGFKTFAQQVPVRPDLYPDPAGETDESSARRLHRHLTAVDSRDLQNGNLVFINFGRNGDSKVTRVTHVGIVDNVKFDSDGNLVSYDVINSRKSTGPVVDAAVVSPANWIHKDVISFARWDTVEKQEQEK